MERLIGTTAPSMALYAPMVRGLASGSPEDAAAVGKRLRALRNALGLSQDRLATSIGMASGSASWSPYERGRDLIPIHNAIALCRIYGVTLDWIYRGLWHAGFPYDLGEKIRFEEYRREERNSKK